MSAASPLAQDRLLLHAVELLKPGGTLVYAVCSLQEDEGPARDRRPAGAATARLRRLPVAAGRTARPRRGASRRQATSAPLPSMWAERGGLDGFLCGARHLPRPG